LITKINLNNWAIKLLLFGNVKFKIKVSIKH